MRAIMVMYDSLNRHFLPPYGCDWTHMPNFQRLAEKSVMFLNNYVGSMPCMPARRELHTGRYNFLHRSWGPMEPFDDSMPSILQQNGIYTHLSSDHYHYWEDGGCSYHTRYTSWQAIRGPEGDPWMGQVASPERIPMVVKGNTETGNTWDGILKHPFRQDLVNRQFMQTEESHPQHQTFAAGLDFIERNHQDDNWFLHLETFDPHEPYFVHQKYRELYPDDYDGAQFDWPDYKKVTETPEEVEHCRKLSAALHSMCDDYLGRVLDTMDRLDMWKDTMLIVNTDHGFLMSEHDTWAKCHCPFYNEIAHSPLFIWDPRSKVQGETRESLTQTIDLAPTLLDFFGVAIPKDMQGVPLGKVIAKDQPIREAGLFGLFGGQINITDGRYVYMRAPTSDDNSPIYEHTHMPTHMRGLFSPIEMRTATMHEPFDFTKECPVMRIKAWTGAPLDRKLEKNQTFLFDLKHDPEQKHPLNDPEQEDRLCRLMVKLMKANDAPEEQYERMGLLSYR